MTDALKPCPFCGSPDGIVMHEAARGIYYECRDGCGAYGPDADNGHWNDRPTERAAYQRGLEDAAKLAENWNSHMSELTDAILACVNRGE